MASPPWV